MVIISRICLSKKWLTSLVKTKNAQRLKNKLFILKSDLGWEQRCVFFLWGLVCVALEFTWTPGFRDASRNEHTDLFPSCFVLSSSQSHKQHCLTNLKHFCIKTQLVAKGTFKKEPSISVWTLSWMFLIFSCSHGWGRVIFFPFFFLRVSFSSFPCWSKQEKRLVFAAVSRQKQTLLVWFNRKNNTASCSFSGFLFLTVMKIHGRMAWRRLNNAEKILAFLVVLLQLRLSPEVCEWSHRLPTGGTRLWGWYLCVFRAFSLVIPPPLPTNVTFQSRSHRTTRDRSSRIHCFS